MLHRLVTFVEGKTLVKPLTMPNVTSFAEPLKFSDEEGAFIDGDAVDDNLPQTSSTGTNTKSKSKKNGMLSLPVDDDLFRFHEVWTWKLMRKRPNMSKEAQKRIQDLFDSKELVISATMHSRCRKF